MFSMDIDTVASFSKNVLEKAINIGNESLFEETGNFPPTLFILTDNLVVIPFYLTGNKDDWPELIASISNKMKLYSYEVEGCFFICETYALHRSEYEECQVKAAMEWYEENGTLLGGPFSYLLNEYLCGYCVSSSGDVCVQHSLITPEQDGYRKFGELKEEYPDDASGNIPSVLMQLFIPANAI